jgi:hypothetical protein
MRNQGTAVDHSGAIWLFGLLLVIAWSASNPYWKRVIAAGMTGKIQRLDVSGGGGTADIGNGLGVTAGIFLLVLVLVGVAKISSNAGAFALVLLLALWVLFLLKHTGAFTSFFAQFTPKAS